MQYMRHIRGSNRRRAFTLIEILLVAGILAVLAAFAIPSLMGQATKAKIDICRASIGQNGPIAKGLDSFKWAIGRYPDTDEGLRVLFLKKGDFGDDQYDGPYLKGAYEKLLDPWSTPYEYRSPGDVNEESFDIYSFGPDRKDDGGKEGSDDIKNWVEK